MIICTECGESFGKGDEEIFGICDACACTLSNSGLLDWSKYDSEKHDPILNVTPLRDDKEDA